MAGRVFTFSFALLSVAAALSLLILLALGSWQVQRLNWKEALLERVQQQIAGEPVQISDLPDHQITEKGSQNDPEYQPVTVSGYFRTNIEYFYYATLNGEPGYHIYTPLAFGDENKQRVVFVNRGFVPLDKKDRDSRPETLTEERVTITGLLRWPELEKPNSFTPDNDFQQNIFFWRDLDAMVTQSGMDSTQVLPFFIYAERTGNELPIGGVSIINFPNNHLQYALTWYGLAATLIGVYGALLIARIRAQQKV